MFPHTLTCCSGITAHSLGIYIIILSMFSNYFSCTPQSLPIPPRVQAPVLGIHRLIETLQLESNSETRGGGLIERTKPHNPLRHTTTHPELMGPWRHHRPIKCTYILYMFTSLHQKPLVPLYWHTYTHTVQVSLSLPVCLSYKHTHAHMCHLWANRRRTDRSFLIKM